MIIIVLFFSVLAAIGENYSTILLGIGAAGLLNITAEQVIEILKSELFWIMIIGPVIKWFAILYCIRLCTWAAKTKKVKVVE